MRLLFSALLGGIACFLLPATANATFIGVSTAPSGGLLYEGLGESVVIPGAGVGIYTLGDCTFDGANTVCTVSGSYVEDAASTNNPGGTGTFVFMQTFSGDDGSPVIARSIAAGSNELNLAAVGDAIFSLTVTPDVGPGFSGIFPDDPFENSIGFSAFLTDAATCTGLSAMTACSVSNVGLTPGSTISGPLSPFVFTIPDSVIIPPAEVPLPGAIAFFISGLGALALRRKRNSAKA